MTVEDLKRWLTNKDTNPTPWLLVVQLVQHAFQTGVVPTRARSNTLVLIPKPEAGQVRGIGLLEPIWKLTSAIVNQRLMSNITFHDDLHGFLPGRGTGTACLEAKLEAQWAFRSGHPLYHIFLDFTKAYDSIDRARTLLLLADYGVGPNTIRLLAMFWERHVVIPRQQQFFGEPFPADRGLTTGDIPAPVIYNIVTDAVLRQWYHDGAARNMTTKARFYADDGALRDQDPAQLQLALSAMEALFLRVGLRVNGRKTKVLAVSPTVATTNISETAYKRRMEGVGDTYQERKRARISCPLCETVLQARNLTTHYRVKHPSIPIPHPTDQPSTQNRTPSYYVLSEPDKHAIMQCPVPDCAVEVVGGWYALRRHFYFRHHADDVHIAEEGELPRCRKCGFQCAQPHDRHQRSKLCKKGQGRQHRRAVTQAIIVSRDLTPEFTAGNITLDPVQSFKYLGRWMSADDSDVMAVTQNIHKARLRWGQLCRLLTRRGASRHVMGLFYKATVQAVLLHGAETWTLTQPLLRLLTSFHHRCARYLARMYNVQHADGTWSAPPSALARDAAGLFTIEEYIQRRVNTFLPFIQSRAIYQSCLESTATQATSNHPCWWLANPLPPPPPHATAAAPAPLEHARRVPTIDTPFLPPRRRSPRRETILV